MKKPAEKSSTSLNVEYSGLVGGISQLLESSRQASARAVNALMTATYWEIGRRIVEFEQGGEKRAEYGTALLANLSLDLCSGKGDALVRYSTDNLPNKVLVRDYLTALPDEATLASEISAARRRLEARQS